MVHSDTNDRSGVNDLFNMPGLVSHTADDLVEDVNKPDGYFNGLWAQTWSRARGWLTKGYGGARAPGGLKIWNERIIQNIEGFLFSGNLYLQYY